MMHKDPKTDLLLPNSQQLNYTHFLIISILLIAVVRIACTSFASKPQIAQWTI